MGEDVKSFGYGFLSPLMRTISHVSREVWDSRFRDSGTGLSVGTGGQASAAGSAPFVVTHTVGASWEVPKRKSQTEPSVCIVISHGGSFQTLVPCVQRGQPLQCALRAMACVLSFKGSEGGPHILSSTHLWLVSSATTGEHSGPASAPLAELG